MRPGLALASLLAPALFAGTADKSAVAPEHSGPPARPAIESRFDTDFNFSAPASFTGSVDAGKISSTSVRATFNETINISQSFSARWLVGWEQYWFSAKNSSGIIPNRMMTVFAGIGAEFRFGGGWMVRADFVPGIASDFDDITWDDVVYNARASVGYRFSESLTVFAGVSVQPQFEFPVLPYVGAIWQINEKWKFNGTFPKASLEYALTDSWFVYGAGRLCRGQPFGQLLTPPLAPPPHLRNPRRPQAHRLWSRGFCESQFIGLSRIGLQRGLESPGRRLTLPELSLSVRTEVAGVCAPSRRAHNMARRLGKNGATPFLLEHRLTKGLPMVPV